ncbi:MAG: hypothetical protein M3Q69_09600 [Acidobacteriota bacterium]|nr:hypothetical protein [Acidobacteriota bacterium]
MTVHLDERSGEAKPGGWTTEAPPWQPSTLAPEHVSETVPTDFRTINGWGADLDPANRPAVPHELPSNVQDVRGEVRYWQVPQDHVNVSIEHPNITPVFGNAVPPHGLSGALRRYAFNYGEATNRHWLTLMLADRIDVVENLVGDALRGRPDNYVREKGWSAKLKYDPGRNRRLLTLGAVALGAVAVGVILTRNRNDD